MIEINDTSAIPSLILSPPILHGSRLGKSRHRLPTPPTIGGPMFAIVAVAVRPNGAPMLSELAVQHCLGCHVRNVAVARIGGLKNAQRRIHN